MPKIPLSPRGDHPITWGKRIPGPRDPLPAQVEEWLEWLQVLRNRPMTTVRAYRQELAKFVAYLSTLVDVRSPDMLEALDRGVLRRYQVQLADVLPNPRSRARSLVALRSFLNYAYDEGWTSTLLSRQIVLPSFVMGDPHPDQDRGRAAPAGRASMCQPPGSARPGARLLSCCRTGCRIAEALALNREDLAPRGFPGARQGWEVQDGLLHRCGAGCGQRLPAPGAGRMRRRHCGSASHARTCTEARPNPAIGSVATAVGGPSRR